MLERPQKIAFEEPRVAQDNILGGKNMNVLVGEN
jgi:hypothetical protein